MRERWRLLLLCSLLVQLSGCGYREDEDRLNTILPDSAAENDFYGMDFGNGNESTSGMKKTLLDSAAENDFYGMDFGNGNESTSGMKKIRRARATVEEDMEVAQKAYDKATDDRTAALARNKTAAAEYDLKKGNREEADRNLKTAKEVLEEAEANKTKADAELEAAEEYVLTNDTAVKSAQGEYDLEVIELGKLTDATGEAKEAYRKANKTFKLAENERSEAGVAQIKAGDAWFAEHQALGIMEANFKEAETNFTNANETFFKNEEKILLYNEYKDLEDKRNKQIDKRPTDPNYSNKYDTEKRKKEDLEAKNSTLWANKVLQGVAKTCNATLTVEAAITDNVEAENILNKDFEKWNGKTGSDGEIFVRYKAMEGAKLRRIRLEELKNLPQINKDEKMENLVNPEKKDYIGKAVKIYRENKLLQPDAPKVWDAVTTVDKALSKCKEEEKKLKETLKTLSKPAEIEATKINIKSTMQERRSLEEIIGLNADFKNYKLQGIVRKYETLTAALKNDADKKKLEENKVLNPEKNWKELTVKKAIEESKADELRLNTTLTNLNKESTPNKEEIEQINYQLEDARAITASLQELDQCGLAVRKVNELVKNYAADFQAWQNYLKTTNLLLQDKNTDWKGLTLQEAFAQSEKEEKKYTYEHDEFTNETKRAKKAGDIKTLLEQTKATTKSLRELQPYYGKDIVESLVSTYGKLKSDLKGKIIKQDSYVTIEDDINKLNTKMEQKRGSKSPETIYSEGEEAEGKKLTLEDEKTNALRVKEDIESEKNIKNELVNGPLPKGLRKIYEAASAELTPKQNAVDGNLTAQNDARIEYEKVADIEQKYKDGKYKTALDKLNDAKEKKGKSEKHRDDAKAAVKDAVKLVNEKTEERDAANGVLEEKKKEEDLAATAAATAERSANNANSDYISKMDERNEKQVALKEELERRGLIFKLAVALGSTTGIIVLAAIGGVIAFVLLKRKKKKTAAKPKQPARQEFDDPCGLTRVVRPGEADQYVVKGKDIQLRGPLIRRKVHNNIPMKHALDGQEGGDKIDKIFFAKELNEGFLIGDGVEIVEPDSITLSEGKNDEDDLPSVKFEWDDGHPPDYSGRYKKEEEAPKKEEKKPRSKKGTSGKSGKSGKSKRPNKAPTPKPASSSGGPSSDSGVGGKKK